MFSETALLDISEQEFKAISALVLERFGINLTDKKKTLVKGRLNKVVKQRGFSSFSEYFEAIQDDTSGKMLTELIDKISTNHTYFFREKSHFEFLTEQVLPPLLDRINADDLRIWCAGCATGEEAYTIAMTLLEQLPQKSAFKGPVILATDISTRALNIAGEGIYSKEKISSINKNMLHRYFTRLPDDRFRINENIKKMILFRRLNFFDETYPFKGKFHIVFCRNVMIYFDTPTKMRLIEKIYNVTLPGGYLFIGHSETLGRDQRLYSYITSATYRKEADG